MSAVSGERLTVGFVLLHEEVAGHIHLFMQHRFNPVHPRGRKEVLLPQILEIFARVGLHGVGDVEEPEPEVVLGVNLVDAGVLLEDLERLVRSDEAVRDHLERLLEGAGRLDEEPELAANDGVWLRLRDSGHDSGHVHPQLPPNIVLLLGPGPHLALGLDGGVVAGPRDLVLWGEGKGLTAVLHLLALANAQVVDRREVVEADLEVDVVVVVFGGVVRVVLDRQELAREDALRHVILELYAILLPHPVHLGPLPALHHQMPDVLSVVCPAEHRFHAVECLLGPEPENNLGSGLHKLLEHL